MVDHREYEKNPLVNSKPFKAFECTNVEDVQKAIKFARDNGKKIRVLSGGHSHAGLSCGEGAVLVDLSKMDSIDYQPYVTDLGENRVRVILGPAAHIEQLKSLVETDHVFFPIGGCDNVSIGGYALGGGWGRFARYIGLGCDKLKQITMVRADGTIEKVTTSDKDDRLKVFRGGGGNLGVVTELVFDYLEKEISNPGISQSFNYEWAFDVNHVNLEETIDSFRLLEAANPSKQDAIPFIKKNEAYKLVIKYLKKFPLEDKHYTSACRIMSVSSKGIKYLHIVINGWYIHTDKTKDDNFIRNIIDAKVKSIVGNELWGKCIHDPDFKLTVDPLSSLGPTCRTAPTEASPIFRLFSKAMGNSNVDVEDDPQPVYSCEHVAYPHIIDSAVPKRTIKEGINLNERHGVAALLKAVLEEKVEEDSTYYVTFHSLGGEICNDGVKSMFPYRMSPYIIQIQGWWENKDSKQHLKAVSKWVDSTRKICERWCRGKFINFTGFDLRQDQQEVSREETLNLYWGEDGRQELVRAKHIYDPEDYFNVYRLL